MYPTPSLFREPSCLEDGLVGQLVKHIVGTGSREGLVERTNVDWQRRRSCACHAPHNRARVRADNSQAQHSVRLGLSAESGDAKRWARRGEEGSSVWLAVCVCLKSAWPCERGLAGLAASHLREHKKFGRLVFSAFHIVTTRGQCYVDSC